MEENNTYLNEEELKLFTSCNPIFSPPQMKIINRRTPPEEIEEKEDNGRKFKSVKSTYAKKIAFIVTGGNYDFKIKRQEFISSTKEITCTARLTIRSNCLTSFREQSGSCRLNTRRANNNNSFAVNIADGHKAAASDAFKKCLSEFGFFWDIYSREIPEGKDDEKKDMPEELVRLDNRLSQLTTSSQINSAYESIEEQVGSDNITGLIEDIFTSHRRRLPRNTHRS